nr:udp-glycosyltransferase 83a1 [Quercus suber]
MGKRAHVLAIAYPAQGHVGPLMKLSQQIADHGIKVTFVNSPYTYTRVLAKMLGKEDWQHQIDIVAGYRSQIGLDQGMTKRTRKISESMFRVMPRKLEDLI